MSRSSFARKDEIQSSRRSGLQLGRRIFLTAHSRSAKGIFTDEFIELFSSLGGLIGVAWRNARQVEKLMRTREKERELEIAREIQMGLLPTRVPAIGGISLAGVCLPAQEVGAATSIFCKGYGRMSWCSTPTG